MGKQAEEESMWYRVKYVVHSDIEKSSVKIITFISTKSGWDEDIPSTYAITSVHKIQETTVKKELAY